MSFIAMLDIFIIICLVIAFYQIIKKTEARKIMVGIIVIYVLSLSAAEIGLVDTAEILRKTSQMLVWGVVFIFHPELRMALRKIGGFTDIKLTEGKRTVANIEDAVFALSRKKVGALIILDDAKSLSNQSEDLVEIDAKCTNELIETLFSPNARLHDGAVIIHGDRIAYAGCKLPLSGKKREGIGHLGTRHLAAIESAENFDITAIVISEETGNVSIANNQGLHKVTNQEMFNSFFKEDDSQFTWFNKIKRKL